MFRVPNDCQIPDPIWRREFFTLDKIYNTYFDEISFVEIGAFDGHTHSNTCLLADDGAKGLYIEAVSEYAQRCRDRHANNNIQVIEAIVSYSNLPVSMVIDGEWSRYVAGSDYQTVTLDSVLEQHPFNDFLLVIDVEGHEYEVLKGFDINKWNPRMCIIEMHEEPSLGWDTQEVFDRNILINNYMREAGYKNVYRDYINTIFIRRDVLKARGNYFENFDYRP